MVVVVVAAAAVVVIVVVFVRVSFGYEVRHYYLKRLIALSNNAKWDNI